MDNLEEFIEDWYWDEQSRLFSLETGRFPMEITDYLEQLPLSEPVKTPTSNQAMVGDGILKRIWRFCLKEYDDLRDSKR